MNETISERHPVYSAGLNIFIILLYVLITLVNFVGNVTVFILFLKFKRLRTPLNYLFLNLSVADLLAGISCYPYIFTDMRNLTVTSPKADIICAFTTGLSIFFVGSVESILTLSFISLNRYLSVKYPLKLSLRLSRRGVRLFVILSWIGAVTMMVPHATSFKYSHERGFCLRHWPNYIDGSLYSLVSTILTGVFPIFVLMSTFITTARQLRAQSRLCSGNNSRTRNLRARKSVIVLLGTLIFLFMVCWIPFFVYWVLLVVFAYFNTKTEEGMIQTMRAYRIVVLFALTSTALDPVVYALRAGQFKSAAKELFSIAPSTLDQSRGDNAGVIYVEERQASRFLTRFNSAISQP